MIYLTMLEYLVVTKFQSDNLQHNNVGKNFFKPSYLRKEMTILIRSVNE